MVVEQITRRFRFNRCVHWEKKNRGRYIGLLNPLFDIDVLLVPWFRDDGDRGFVEWLIFRFGWYPIPPRSSTEVSSYNRKKLEEIFKEGGTQNGS